MSSIDTWYEHSVFCETENKIVTQITKTQDALTVCPNNSAHTIDAESNYISSQKSSTTVNITQEQNSSTTHGKYSCHSRTCLAIGCATGAESTGRLTSDVFRLNVPFSVFTGIFQARSGMDRDRIDLRLVPKTPQTLGILTATGSYGDTVLHVYSPALALAESESATVYITNMLTGLQSEYVDVQSVNVTGGTITLKSGLELEDATSIPPGATSVVTLLSNNFGTITTGHPIKTTNRWVYLTAPQVVWDELIEGRWINAFRSPEQKTERRMIDEVDLVNGRVHLNAPFDIALDPADGTIYFQLVLKLLHNKVLQDDTRFTLGQTLIGGAYHPRDLTIIADYTRKRTTDIEFDYMFEMFI